MNSPCPNCFTSYEENSRTCPHCNWENTQPAVEGALPLFTPLLRQGDGRYTFTTGRVLGKGGFGITYLAFDEHFRCRRAIKEFFPDRSCRRQPGKKQIELINQNTDNQRYYDEFKRRFIAEAKILNELRHPNIVEIKSLFEENGTAYFVMDYWPAKTLADYVEPGHLLPQEAAIECMVRVMDALEHCHAKHIYHRDIKPANILMTGERTIKLLDFGGAKAEQQNQTQSGQSVGVITFPYGAPEQAGGEHIGSWTDVYACGATLYHLLTGKEPPSFTDRLHNENLDWEGSSIPAHIRQAIQNAMQISWRNRTQKPSEFIRQLQTPQPAAKPPLPKKPHWAWFAAPGVALIAGLASWLLLGHSTNATTPAPVLSVPPPLPAVPTPSVTQPPSQPPAETPAPAPDPKPSAKARPKAESPSQAKPEKPKSPRSNRNTSEEDDCLEGTGPCVIKKSELPKSGSR